MQAFTLAGAVGLCHGRRMTRYRFFALILALAALANTVRAEPPRWRYGDTDTEVILFGTIDPINANTGWVTDAFARQIESATAIYLEVAPEEAAPDVIGPLLTQYGFLSPRNTLDRSMPAALYARVKAALDAAGHREADYSQWRPWLAGIYARTATLGQLGYTSADGVDQQIASVGTRLGIPVLGLERFLEQILVFDSLTLDQELQLVDGLVEDTTSMRRRIDAMTRAWLAGDAAQASAIMQRGFATTPALKTAIFETRSQKWLPSLVGLLNRPGRYIVAVGLANLTGEAGVIALLEANDIAVTRLDTPVR